jgi:glycosyltransferase involved in cell wall biosynthesis
VSLVSVIVPIYKVEAELRECVDSVLDQTLQDIEVVLVDDGSPDACPQICDEYGAYDNRVRVIHKRNGGLSDARNAGLDVATGEYVMFVDSDDRIEPDSCERLYRTAKKLNADIVLGDWNVCPGPTSPDHYSSLEEGKTYTPKEFIATVLPKGQWYPCACFMCCRRAFFEENNLRFAVGLLHEDMEMQPRIFLAAKAICCIKFKFYQYVKRPGSIMRSSNNAKRASSMAEILGRWKIQFDSIGDAELKALLNGYLAKCYLHTCRELNLRDGLQVDGVDKAFLVKSGLNAKEKIKGMLYAASPRLYSYL